LRAGAAKSLIFRFWLSQTGNQLPQASVSHLAPPLTREQPRAGPVMCSAPGCDAPTEICCHPDDPDLLQSVFSRPSPLCRPLFYCGSPMLPRPSFFKEVVLRLAHALLRVLPGPPPSWQRIRKACASHRVVHLVFTSSDPPPATPRPLLHFSWLLVPRTLLCPRAGVVSVHSAILRLARLSHLTSF